MRKCSCSEIRGDVIHTIINKSYATAAETASHTVTYEEEENEGYSKWGLDMQNLFSVG